MHSSEVALLDDDDATPAPAVAAQSAPHRRTLRMRLGLDADAAVRKVRFGLVGLSGVAVSFSSLYLLVDVLGWHRSLGYAIQTVLAVETNFFGNALWTWCDRKGVSLGRAWVRFHAARVGLMIPINQVVFWFFQPQLGTVPANAVCIGLATVANWFLNDRLVFRSSGSSTYKERP
jgi:putative flippase GtrA